MDFEELADRAQEAEIAQPDTRTRPVSGGVSEHSLYVLDDVGLWRAARDGEHGVVLRRLFSGDREYRSLEQWAGQCAAGRIREVR